VLHLKRYKHMWFVFLMILFIGGSNVAIAAVHAIHTEQSTVTTQDMPCHKMQMKSDQHHQIQMAHQDMTSMTKCHDQQVPNQQHCEDCNHPSHCQTVSFTLDQNIPELSALSVFERPIHLITAYQARHLAGYWQEILRPPKA